MIEVDMSKMSHTKASVLSCVEVWMSITGARIWGHGGPNPPSMIRRSTFDSLIADELLKLERKTWGGANFVYKPTESGRLAVRSWVQIHGEPL